MKYILIKGSKDSGKSTTCNEVCRQLNPDKISVLRNGKDKTNAFFEQVETTLEILNETYLLEIGRKKVLIMSGSPTEQGIKITIIIEIIISLEIEIDFALIAMRSFEKAPDFNTIKELELVGESVLIEKIERINDSVFMQTDIWKSRIERITKLIKANI
jgi:hypothetical protein